MRVRVRVVRVRVCVRVYVRTHILLHVHLHLHPRLHLHMHVHLYKGMRLNHALFLLNGGCGYLLRPHWQLAGLNANTLGERSGSRSGGSEFRMRVCTCTSFCVSVFALVVSLVPVLDLVEVRQEFS